MLGQSIFWFSYFGVAIISRLSQIWSTIYWLLIAGVAGFDYILLIFNVSFQC